MKYRRFKTLILDYIDTIPELESVEWVYYLDIDIIMGQVSISFVVKRSFFSAPSRVVPNPYCENSVNISSR